MTDISGPAVADRRGRQDGDIQTASTSRVRALLEPPRGLRGWLRLTRYLGTAVGIAGLIALAFSGNADDDMALGMVCIVGFAGAVAAGWWEVGSQPRVAAAPVTPVMRGPRWSWWAATVMAVSVPALAVQTWFQGDAVIAGGDITPPVGTAWLNRIFAGTVTSGSDIGIANGQETNLPWAAVVFVVRHLGGSAAMTQRVWFTLLVAGAALCALLLLRGLGVGPLGACAGALVYVGNGYVVGFANINAVYLAALVLLAAYPAILLNAAFGRLRVRTAVVLLAVTGPLLGYVYHNPPLVGMVLAVLVMSAVLAWLMAGRLALLRGLRVLVFGGTLLAAVSAYWIAPVAAQIPLVASGSLGDVTSWAFTQTRATLANAFWLNTTWAWSHPEYYPYASTYADFPLSALRFALPAAALGALALGRARAGSENDGHHRRLVLILSMATLALLLIFVSTGTRPPGSILFNPLYSLPDGYLLREPGRFLMVVGLAYAVLFGVAVDAAAPHVRRAIASRWRIPSRRLLPLLRPPAIATGALAGAVTLALLAPAYPLATGAVVPDKRPQLPSSHVHVPQYWTDMAAYIDALPVEGSLLILPSSDFYQMPYTWGYYGADEFIYDLISRPTFVDSGTGGYLVGAVQVGDTVAALTDALLAGDWNEADALAQVEGNALILVRGDVDDSMPGRTIVSPRALSAALRAAPGFQLVHEVGPLELFQVSRPPGRDVTTPQPFATVDAVTPNLGVLSLLPPGTHLVSATSPYPGHMTVVQTPPLEQWQVQGDHAAVRLAGPPGWSYDLGVVGHPDAHIVGPAPPAGGTVDVLTGLVASGSSEGVHLTLDLGPNLVDNGPPALTAWGPVSDCNAQSSAALAQIHAEVIPGTDAGQPALRLSAARDSACVAQNLRWNGEPVLVSARLRRVTGAAPRICLWEVGLNRCVRMRDPLTSGSWSEYAAPAVPEPGTTGLRLFLYADAETGGSTIADYEDMGVHSLPSGAQGRSLIGDPGVTDARWPPVGDCNDIHGGVASELQAITLPGAAPDGAAALRLSARQDSACVSEPLTWFGGRVVVHLEVRHVAGAPPRLCLWEEGVNRCATLPATPAMSGDWSDYRAVVTPDPGATSLQLFLYADATGDGSRTVDDYAGVAVTETEAIPATVLIGTPLTQRADKTRLYEIRSAFSSQWDGGPSAREVRVDGVFSGWLVSANAGRPQVTFRPQAMIDRGFLISKVAAVVTVALVLWSFIELVRRWWRRRTPRPSS